MADISELKFEDPLAPLTVVVRSNLQGIYLRRRIAAIYGGVCNVNFYTLTDLAKSLLPDNEITTASAEALVLMARIALHAQPEDSHFARFRDFDGAEAAFASTFKELSFSGFSSKDISGKIPAFGPLYDDYLQLLERNLFLEEGGLFIEAGKAVSTCEDPVFIYGMYEFFTAHRSFVETLAESRPVRLYLPFNEHLALTTKTRDWLLSKSFTPENVSERRDESSIVTRFADNLFNPGTGGLTDGETIKIIAGRDEYDEVNLVAVEIIRLIAEKKTEPPDIAVVVNGLGRYLPIIDEVFGGGDGKYDIPYYLSPGFPVKLTREGRALLLLLKLIASPRKQRTRFDIVELLSFARDVEVNSSLYNRITLDAGIITGDDFSDKLKFNLLRLEREEENARGRGDDNGAAKLRTEVTAARELLEISGKLFKYLKDFETLNDKPWTYFCSLVRKMIEGVFVAPHNFDDLLDYVDQLTDLDDLETDGAKVDKALFVGNATALIESKTEKRGSFGKSGVNVLDTRLARGLRFDNVFVLGLTEGSLPRKYRQDPVLLDEKRENLNIAAGSNAKIPLRSEDSDVDEALFWSVLHTARERLYSCCPCAEENALRPKVPSYYLLLAMGKLRSERYSLMDFYRDYGKPARGFDQALDSEAFYRFAAEVAAESTRSILAKTNPYFRRGLDLTAAKYSATLTEYDGYINESKILPELTGLMRWGEPIAPTVLEKYLDCPFKFFLSRVLRIEKPIEADKVFELSAMDKGKLVHSILYDFYSRLRDSSGLPLRAELYGQYGKTLGGIFAKRFAEAERGGIIGLPLSWEMAKRDIELAITAYVRAEVSNDIIDVVPTYFELRFGYRGRADDEDPHSTPDPYRLNIGGRELLFSGKVDRVDIGENRARVIDYKSGTYAKTKTEITSYNSLQLPIYLLAAAHLTGREIPSVDALYSYIYLGTTRELSGEELQHDLDVTFRRKLAELLKLIETGYFANLKSKCGDEYNKCDWLAVCRPVSEYLVDRKKETQPAVAYARMRENDFDE